MCIRHGAEAATGVLDFPSTVLSSRHTVVRVHGRRREEVIRRRRTEEPARSHPTAADNDTFLQHSNAEITHKYLTL